MKKWFFYQERGKTVGPLTIEDMKARIREGRIQLFDLIHSEGEDGWKMAMEFPDLRGEFKNSTMPTMNDRPWVCLRRRSEKALDFSTSGPFTTAEIQKSVAAGEISYSDYIWKEGFNEWRRIGTVEDFNRRLQERLEEKKTEKLPPLPLDLPPHQILKNVVEFKRARPIEEPPPPPEVTGKDLTAEPKSAAPAMPKMKTHEIPPLKDKNLPSEEVTNTNIKPFKKRSLRLLDWGVVAVLVIVLCGVALGVTRYMKRTPAPEIEPEPVAQAPQPPEVNPQPMQAKQDERPEGLPDTPPTELFLRAQTLGATQVKIEIRSDSGPSYPIYVQIIGLPGQVTEGASFYRYLKFQPSGDPRQPIDLSDVKLPQGRFILRAQTGKLNKEARINIGVNETHYKQTVGRLRKAHSAAIWKERLALFNLAQILEKQVTEAASGKRFSGKGLGALMAVKRSSGANYILFEEWFELRDIMQTAKTNASMALLMRAKQARERISTFSVWK